MAIAALGPNPVIQRITAVPEEAKKSEHSASPDPMLRTLDRFYRVALAALVKRSPEDPVVGGLTDVLQRNLEAHVRTDQAFQSGLVVLLGSAPSPSNPQTSIALKLRLGSEHPTYGGKVYVTASNGIKGTYKRYSEAYEVLFRSFHGFLSMPKGTKEAPGKWSPNGLREWQSIMRFCPRPGMAHCHEMFLYKSPKQADRERVGMVFDRFDGDLQMIHPIKKEQDLRQVLINSAQSLLLLHESGVVHRDIKPENFGVQIKNWRVRILDPGFACLTGEPVKLCGSPVYLAPEVFSHVILLSKEPKTPPPPSLPSQDVWSFGVMMYSLSTGYTPSFQEVLTGNLIKKMPIDFSRLSGLIDEELSKKNGLTTQMKTLLRGILQIDLSQRFNMKMVLDFMRQPDFIVREESFQIPSSKEAEKK